MLVDSRSDVPLRKRDGARGNIEGERTRSALTISFSLFKLNQATDQATISPRERCGAKQKFGRGWRVRGEASAIDRRADSSWDWSAYLRTDVGGSD